MPPKKSESLKKKSTSGGHKIKWGEVVEGYNVREKEMKPMKVIEICKYESSVNKRPIFRLAGEDAATGQKMSKFTSEESAALIASVADLKIKKCVMVKAKPKVKAPAKAPAKAEAKAKAPAKPKVKAEAKPKVKAEAKPKVKAEAKPKAKAPAKPKAKAPAKVKAEAKPKAKAEAKAEAKPKAKAPAKAKIVKK